MARNNPLAWTLRGAFRRWLLVPLSALTLATSGCAGLVRPDASDWGDTAAKDGSWSIMSFNLLVGGQPAADAMDAIASASPDLLCLQEMTPQFAEAFARRFSASYPYLLFEPHPTVQGIGIASRYRLSEGELLTLGLPYMPAVAATVHLDQEAVRIACAHFVPHIANFEPSDGIRDRYYRNRTIRTGQAQALLDHLNSNGNPAIVLGDLNEWKGQAALTELAEAGFRDACQAPDSRCGPTWPGRVSYGPALVQLDHILGRGIEFRQATVLGAGGSDHYPIIARFRPTVK